ncbi:MAG: prepilin-type N-terminal cleavage/methylation domain-containing protein [Oscillospiraceae bacterium]|nr:prepilin-type N-terminal cleavage/methylation domain-containing protein [Oscillospiraceae bacterium]
MPIRKSAARNGFTLVEVIVVLVILAILAVLLIPAMTGWIDRARKQSAIADCRSAVLAAQGLASEHYADGGAVDAQEVAELAQVKGTVSGMEFDPDNAELLHLAYTRSPWTVTYCRYPDACGLHSETYTITDGTLAGWAVNTPYAVGDVVVINGIRFQCARAHTSGTTAATRNPAVGMNKSTWVVVGFEDGADDSYSSSYRYAEGVVVTYSGNRYKRTGYDLGGGQTPPRAGNSDYWTLVN